MQHGAGNVLGIIVAVTTALSDSWSTGTLRLQRRNLVSIDLYQYPAVIAWPPGVNFVEGTDRDSFVEAA